MAADDTHEFLTPENIDAGSTPAQTRDVGGGRRELATLNPQGQKPAPPPQSQSTRGSGSRGACLPSGWNALPTSQPAAAVASRASSWPKS